MDSRQLEYFVAVAEELSFTRAAQRVFTVQSTVSAAIRALESDLKTTLFDRSTRRVVLSAAGQALLPEAKAALEALDRARAAVEEASSGLRGSIRIGTLARLSLVNMAELLGAFHRTYPLVEMQVATSPTGSTGLADDVRHGRLDVALLGLPKPELSGLDVRDIATVPFVALVPASHPLAGHTAGVRLEELAGERFVDMPTGFGNRKMVDRAFDTIGTPRRIQVEVPELTTIPDYVRVGLGVAVVPDLELPEERGVAKLPINGTDLIWTLSVVTLAGRRPSRAVTALLDLIGDSTSPEGPYF
ncbi:LysR family transcriptional regulator [Kribbella kalugense]|uniref:DNA-binding transcriptional LysR family regulator n=1 Tax=Kribbella kalugense TaxID=2512221 RepID=A0A4V3G774_9ACTN|nr:LysR family transcriptional regulator [Kribbella kalugense]TDW18014.1 DNA-binding transcriptional LysR family regulator [Kribbella kalugense]